MWRTIIKGLGLTAGVATLTCIGWKHAADDTSQSYVPYSAFLNATQSLINDTVANATSHSEPPTPIQPPFTLDDVYRMMVKFIPVLSSLVAQASIDAVNNARVVSTEWWHQRYPQHTAYIVILSIGCLYLDQLARAAVQAIESVFGDRVGLREYFKKWASVELAKIKAEHEEHMAEHEQRKAEFAQEVREFDLVVKNKEDRRMMIVDALIAQDHYLEAANVLGATEERMAAIEAVGVPLLTEGPPEGRTASDEQEPEELTEQAEALPERTTDIEEQRYEEEAKQAEGPPEGMRSTEEQQPEEDLSTGGPPTKTRTEEENADEEADDASEDAGPSTEGQAGRSTRRGRKPNFLRRKEKAAKKAALAALAEGGSGQAS